jgi:hypothetical protein
VIIFAFKTIISYLRERKLRFSDIIRTADYDSSLSLFQFFVWTIIIIFSFFGIYVARYLSGVFEPLSCGIPAGILELMDISISTPFISSYITKIKEIPSAKDKESFHYYTSTNWDTSLNEPSQGTTLPYGWGKIQRDIIIAPAKIANAPKPITLTQDGKILEMVEACLLESDKGIAIVLLNWSDTPEHVPIKNLTITINNSLVRGIQGNPEPPVIPVGSKIYSAHAKDGVIVTPSSTRSSWQLPFSITLSQLDYVDVIMMDAETPSTTTGEVEKKKKVHHVSHGWSPYQSNFKVTPA